ncbi:MAG: PEP-CTERM sorting domain-containing protein, partial [Phycisphaerae bacterium]|nr:PEP-CTERM sorting domain-containing protein [Phycisphaerae bacterium]
YDVSGDSIIGWADSNDLIRTMLGTEYGDANLDLRVDLDDYNLLAANFGLTGGWAKGDFNGDKKVNFADYQILEVTFGFGTGGSPAPPPVPIPEPATGTLLGLGALAMIRRRR